MESQKKTVTPATGGERLGRDSVPDSFGSSSSGSPLADADEWQLLSERGGSSQAVFVPKKIKSDQPVPTAQQNSESEGRNIFQPWDQVKPVPVPRLPLTRDGSTGQRANQIFHEMQSTPENRRASPGHGTPPRNTSSVVDDDEFFTSDGYFSAMPPSARTAHGNNEPRQATRPAALPESYSTNQLPSVLGSPAKEQLHGEASPIRDLTERYMPARGLSALDSFLNASEIELGALELLAQCRGDISVDKTVTDGTFAVPAARADDAELIPPPSSEAQNFIPTKADEKPETQLAEGRSEDISGEVALDSTPQLEAELQPQGAESSDSPQSIRAVVTFLFTWALHIATKKDSSSTTVVATCLIAGIGVGGLAELIRKLSTTNTEETPTHETHSSPTPVSASISSLDLHEEVEKMAKSELRALKRGLVAGATWMALLCGVPFNSTSEKSPKTLTSSRQEGSTDAANTKSQRRSKSSSQQSEPDTASTSNIQDQFKAEILRVPPLVRFGCCMLTCTVLLGPITQWLTVGAIIRGGSVLATLVSGAQVLGQGESCKTQGSSSSSSSRSSSKLGQQSRKSTESCFSGEVD